MSTTATTYSATADWAQAEVANARLGDTRLIKRYAMMLSQMFTHAASSLPQTFGCAAAVKAAYNFLSNEAVTATALIAPHAAATRQRCEAEALVLAVQDTTEVSFTTLKHTTGLGRLRKHSRGILVHSCLAVSVDGRPLGLLDQHQWTRDSPEPIASTRRSRPTAEKESQRWIDMITSVEAQLRTPTVVVADCEADIFDVFAYQRAAHVELLIRATHNRKLNGEYQLLHTAIDNAEPLGGMLVELQRTPDRTARVAGCVVSRISVELQPPHQRRGASVAVTLIHVQEIDPVGKPIDWILATTLPVDTLEDALRIVGYYVTRWVIERFHYTLKSGCQIEKLQLEEAPRLINAIALYSVVAWRLLWLNYCARHTPEVSPTMMLSQEHLTVLCADRARKTGKPISHSPTIAEAVRWIAQLGGYLARTSDGPPGVKTLWIGLRRLDALVDGWLLAQSMISPSLMGNG